MKHSPEIEATIAELEKHGATVTDVTQGRKHAKVRFVYRGKKRFMTCSMSGSDHRGPANARQSVRKELSIIRGKKIGARRSRKDRCRFDVVTAPKLTPGRDPFAPLQGTTIVRAALNIAAERAWAQWFGGILKSNGHRPITEAMK